MSRLSNFLDFVRREEDNTIWEDATYRAYDLDRMTGERSLQNAARYVGYTYISDLVSDVRGMGYTGYVVAPLLRYWVWHRLMTGQMRKWPLRKAVCMALNRRGKSEYGNMARTFASAETEQKAKTP